jgi:TonB family protein
LGHILEVSPDARFVCEKCGKPLIEAAPRAALRSASPGLLVSGGLAIAGVCLIGGGMALTHSGSMPAHASGMAPASQATRAAVAAQAVREAATPLTGAQAPTPAQTTSPMPASPTQAAQLDATRPLPGEGTGAGMNGAKPQQAVLTQAAFIQAFPPAASPFSPAVTIPLGRATQAQVEMLQHRLPLARVIPTPSPDDIALARAKQQAALAKLAQDKLAQDKLAQDKLAQEKLAQEKLAQEKLAQQQAAARAPQPAANPPAPIERAAFAEPTGITRAFSPRVIAGGHPMFPHSYADEDRTGSVTVRCTIDTSGAPANCGVERSEGGDDFGRSVLKWLDSGRVRFAPILRNGAPVAESHSWQIAFQLK